MTCTITRQKDSNLNIPTLFMTNEGTSSKVRIRPGWTDCLIAFSTIELRVTCATNQQGSGSAVWSRTLIPHIMLGHATCWTRLDSVLWWYQRAYSIPKFLNFLMRHFRKGAPRESCGVSPNSLAHYCT